MTTERPTREAKGKPRRKRARRRSLLDYRTTSTRRWCTESRKKHPEKPLQSIMMRTMITRWPLIIMQEVLAKLEIPLSRGLSELARPTTPTTGLQATTQR